MNYNDHRLIAHIPKSQVYLEGDWGALIMLLLLVVGISLSAYQLIRHRKLSHAGIWYLLAIIPFSSGEPVITNSYEFVFTIRHSDRIHIPTWQIHSDGNFGVLITLMLLAFGIILGAYQLIRLRKSSRSGI